jgi:GT2 family glycosyltransferase
VYVDSGSTDGSVEFARSVGVEVVELDTSVPFTAARARNRGFERLIEIRPTCRYVQFVDGDCQVDPDWLSVARAELDQRPGVVVVCGRRRERYPGASVYNKLCDLEWDTPVGEAAACGGDAMMRVESLRAVGGFNPALIAGEEPELCVRLRLAGGKIVRLDAEMTLHDAAMTRLGQWWKRAVRAGHAYAQGAALHGSGPTRHGAKQVRGILFWGAVVPAAIGVGAVLAVTAHGWAWWCVAGLGTGYPVLAARIYASQRRAGRSKSDAAVYAWFCVLGKFAQVTGLLRYWTNRLLKRRQTLIEYK